MDTQQRSEPFLSYEDEIFEVTGIKNSFVNCLVIKGYLNLASCTVQAF
jgi:hypothetical protein